MEHQMDILNKLEESIKKRENNLEGNAIISLKQLNQLVEALKSFLPKTDANSSALALRLSLIHI